MHQESHANSDTIYLDENGQVSVEPESLVNIDAVSDFDTLTVERTDF